MSDKSPGQLAFEAHRDYLDGSRPWSDVRPPERGLWDATAAAVTEAAPSLAAHSPEPGRHDFRTALTRLIHEYSLDVEAGQDAGEIAAKMDEFRMKLARSTREARDAR